MSVFVHAQGIKTVHAGGGGVKKWQNSVHVVIEFPLTQIQMETVHSAVDDLFVNLHSTRLDCRVCIQRLCNMYIILNGNTV